MRLIDRPLEKAPPLYQQAYKVMREALIQGDLKPGERLTESRVAEWLSISRTPVREAFRQLHREALVEMDEHGRIRVPAIRAKDIRDFFECRVALETAAALRATACATGEDVQQLTEILERAEQANAEGDVFQVLQHNWMFHQRLVRLSGNQPMLALLEHIWNRIQLVRALIPRHVGRSQRVMREHRDILKAVRGGDGDEAAGRLRDHLESAAGRYLAHLEELAESGAQ